MNKLDEVLAHYEKPVYTEQEVQEMTTEAAEHLTNYLVGDGNVQHLYDYHECMEKIN